jgi:hypothetical protein
MLRTLLNTTLLFPCAFALAWCQVLHTAEYIHKSQHELEPLIQRSATTFHGVNQPFYIAYIGIYFRGFIHLMNKFIYGRSHESVPVHCSTYL